MKVKMEPTRKGFGLSLAANGDDERVVCLGLDSPDRSRSAIPRASRTRKERWISMGIAEQSATSAAAGLAREGKLPVFGTYATFAAARNLDQIRTSICYGNFNVMIAGAHGGVSVGPDGATHQVLEDLFAVQGLPNMSVVAPFDLEETRKATIICCCITGARSISASPARPRRSSPTRRLRSCLVMRMSFACGGKAQIYQCLRDHTGLFLQNEGEDLSIIACGPMVPEAMRAAYILKREFGYETRVINMHTLKPIDADAIIRAARETGVIVTAEEHQIGALAWRVSGILTETPNSFTAFR